MPLTRLSKNWRVFDDFSVIASIFIRNLVMRFYNKISIALLIQSIGPLLLYYFIGVISRDLGPDIQGQFSELKYSVDFLVSLLIFGLPQIYIREIHKSNLLRRELIKKSLLYVSFLIFIGMAFCFIIPNFVFLRFFFGSTINFFWIVLATCGLVTFSLLRPIYLTISDGWKFSILSVQPNIIICVLFFLLNEHFTYDPYILYGLVGLYSAMISLCFISLEHKSIKIKKTSCKTSWISLVGNSYNILIQDLSVAIQPLILIFILKTYHAGYENIGFFSISLYACQASIIPLGLISPLILNRWSRSSNMASNLLEIKFFLKIAFLVLLFVAAVHNVIPQLFVKFLGFKYLGSIGIIQIMIFSIPFMFANSILSIFLSSRGFYIYIGRIFFSKIVFCVLSALLLISTYKLSPIIASSISFLGAEILQTLLTVKYLSKLLLVSREAS